VDVNIAKENHIKYRYPNEQHCKGARKQCVLWKYSLYLGLGNLVRLIFVAQYTNPLLVQCCELLYEVSRLLPHHSRENQASAEKNGTSKVENIDIKTSTKPGDGFRRKQRSATLFNHFKIKPFLTISQNPRGKSYVSVQLRCQLDFSFKRKVLCISLLLVSIIVVNHQNWYMFTVVLIKNQAFWARAFLLTERQVLDAYENPLNPINRHSLFRKRH